MGRFKNPRCQAPDVMRGRPDEACGVEMKLMGERHPLYRPGSYIFICPRCESIRHIDERTAERYAERA